MLETADPVEINGECLRPQMKPPRSIEYMLQQALQKRKARIKKRLGRQWGAPRKNIAGCAAAAPANAKTSAALRMLRMVIDPQFRLSGATQDWSQKSKRSRLRS